MHPGKRECIFKREDMNIQDSKKWHMTERETYSKTGKAGECEG